MITNYKKYKANLTKALIILLVNLLYVTTAFSSNIIIDTSICFGSEFYFEIKTEPFEQKFIIYNLEGDKLNEQEVKNERVSFVIKPKWLKQGKNSFILKSLNSKKDSVINTSKININTISLPQASILGNSLLCPNQYEVIYSTDLDEGYTYKWNVFGGEIIDNDSNSIIFVNWYGSGSGKVILEKTNKTNNCSVNIIKDIIIEDIEKPSIIKCPNNKVINYYESDHSLEINDNSFDMIATDNCELLSVINDYNYSSTLADEVIYDPVEITWTATDKENNTSYCSFTISFNYIKTLTPPNAFSPNGDGINDTWKIEELSMYPNAIVQVRNKSGEIVFESETGYPYEWDGTQNGRELRVDTYYYYIFLDNNSKTIQGIVTILK